MHAPIGGLYLALAVLALRGTAWTGNLSEGAARYSVDLPDVSSTIPIHDLPAIERLVLLLAWLGHGLLLYVSIFRPAGLQFGFALALSATMWLAIAVYWVESLYFSLASMRLLILPLAACSALLPYWFPGSLSQVSIGNVAFELHLVVAVSAYGLLTIAALHALLMAALDRWLHGSELVPRIDARSSRRIGLWIRIQEAVLGKLPPLLTMERLLFRTLAAGFVLLTLTLLSGLIFSEEVFGRAFRFEHKTVFALVSWMLFGGLLFGRVFYGWRGRMALRWTLAGFGMMLLAYVGSRFVLEVILRRF